MEMKVWLPRALHGAGVSWLGLLPRGSQGSSLSLSCFRQRRGCLGTDGGTRDPLAGEGAHLSSPWRDLWGSWGWRLDPTPPSLTAGLPSV